MMEPSCDAIVMSALLPIADIGCRQSNVCFVPIADIDDYLITSSATVIRPMTE
jgi:hypothetical protein